MAEPQSEGILPFYLDLLKQSAANAPGRLRDAVRFAQGSPEAATTMATGLLSMPRAGYEGLLVGTTKPEQRPMGVWVDGQWIPSLMGTDPMPAAAAVERRMESGTMLPGSDAGMETLQGIGGAMETLIDPMRSAGDTAVAKGVEWGLPPELLAGLAAGTLALADTIPGPPATTLTRTAGRAARRATRATPDMPQSGFGGIGLDVMDDAYSPMTGQVTDVPIIGGGQFYRGSQNKGAVPFNGDPTGATDVGQPMYVGSKETAQLYAKDGGEVFSADVEPGRYIDASTKHGSDLVQQFSRETGNNPYLKSTDRGSAPNWTVSYDFESWLDAKGIDYDGVFYAENNNTASLSLKNRQKAKVRSVAPTRPGQPSIDQMGSTLKYLDKYDETMAGHFARAQDQLGQTATGRGQRGNIDLEGGDKILKTQAGRNVVDLNQRRKESQRQHDEIINEIRMRVTKDISDMETSARLADVDPDSIHKIGDRFVSPGPAIVRGTKMPGAVRLEIKKYNRVNDDGTVYYDVEQTFPDGTKGQVTLKNENLEGADKQGGLFSVDQGRTGLLNMPEPASSVTIGEKTFVPQRTDRGNQVVMMPREELEGLLTNEFVGPGPTYENQIGRRIENFENYLANNDRIELGDLHINTDGATPYASFGDGRHRTRVLLDSGMEEIPVSMTPDNVRKLSELRSADVKNIHDSKITELLDQWNAMDEGLNRASELFKEQTGFYPGEAKIVEVGGRLMLDNPAAMDNIRRLAFRSGIAPDELLDSVIGYRREFDRIATRQGQVSDAINIYQQSTGNPYYVPPKQRGSVKDTGAGKEVLKTQAERVGLLHGTETELLARDFNAQPQTKKAKDEFNQRLSESRQAMTIKDRAQVDDVLPDNFDGTTYITNDGAAGFAMSKDGYISNLFRHPDAEFSGTMGAALTKARAAGAKNLEAFDTYLVDGYISRGARETGRSPWNPDYATPEMIEAFGDTKPDFVQMDIGGVIPTQKHSILHGPRVQQELARFHAARGEPKAITDAFKGGKVNRLNRIVQKGLEQGGEKWYWMGGLLDQFIGELGPDLGLQRFDDFMDLNAAVSPRSAVSMQIKRASVLYQRLVKGESLDLKQPPGTKANPTGEGPHYPPGYGHLAADIHASNVGILNPQGGTLTGEFSSIDQPKIGSYSPNMKGNYIPLTSDSHNNLIVTGREGSPTAAQYPYLESRQADLGARMGLDPSEWQSALWVGGGDITGVRDVRNLPDAMNQRIAMTSEVLGIPEQEVLIRFMHGDIRLYSVMGAMFLGGKLMGQAEEETPVNSL